jgi:transcriptional antiterminator RfaH
MSKEWFILQLKANAHHRAVKNLNKQGFETFLPLHDVTSRKTSRFINATQPLFPAYMFITFDKKRSDWSKIKNTYGVSRLITFNSILKSIPTEVVNNLIERCDLAGKLLPEKKLKNGDQVKVLSGPLASFIATVETYETDQRIWILLDLMSRKAKVQIPSENLELLS